MFHVQVKSKVAKTRIAFRQSLRRLIAQGACIHPDAVRDAEQLGPFFASLLRAAAREHFLLIRHTGQLTEHSTVDDAVDFLTDLWRSHRSQPPRRTSKRRTKA